MNEYLPTSISGRTTKEETKLTEENGKLVETIRKLRNAVDPKFSDVNVLASEAWPNIGTHPAALAFQTAHALKSSSNNVGATGLADLCKHLETMARENRLSDTATIRHRLEREFERVVAAPRIQAGSAAA